MTPMRVCHFRPYRKKHGPTFTLTMGEPVGHATYRVYVPYRLTMREGRTRTVLFEGTYFGCSPMHAIDSDASVRALMGFLTLRPGDMDAEYFDDYTDTQRDYCAQHAEALSACYWRGHMLTEDVR